MTEYAIVGACASLAVSLVALGSGNAPPGGNARNGASAPANGALVSPQRDNAGDTGSAAANSDGAGEMDWTRFRPSPDTRMVFVSASQGSDANAGLSPESPVQSLAKGVSLLRSGYPDWLLLRSGDVWTGQDFGKFTKAGRSEKEPMLISSYGQGGDRPLIETGTAKRGIWFDGTKGASHIALAGLEFHAHAYDGTEGAEAGVLWLGPGENFLIEDCYIRGYKDNIVLNGFSGMLSDARVRACVIADSFSVSAHSQGLYAEKVEDLLIEWSVFDHNGWNDEVDGAQPTMFNHNIYVQRGCDEVSIVNNVLTRAAAHGVLLRSNGKMENNLFLRNPIAIVAGDNDDPAANPIAIDISGNVILQGTDISPDLPRGMGIDLYDTTDAQVTGNIIAHDESSKPYGHAVMLHGAASAPIQNAMIANNTVFAWRGGFKHDKEGLDEVVIHDNLVQATDSSVPVVKHKGSPEGVVYGGNVYHSEAPPVLWFELDGALYNYAEWKDKTGERGGAAAGAGFVDPERTPETYQSAIGGEASFEAFMAELRAQAKIDWNPGYAPPVVLEYFRSGFATTNTLTTPAPGAPVQ